MKKYKLELVIGTIFLGIVSALLWTTMSGIWKPLPYVLAAVCFAAFVVFAMPWGEKSAEASGGERYAPKFFAQAVISSIIGIAVIIGLAAILNRERFSKTFDLTANKVNSLSSETEKYITSLTEEVEVWCIPAVSQTERFCEDSAQLRRLYAEKSPKLIMGNVDLGNMALVQKVKPTGYGRLVFITKDNRSELVGKVTESKLTNALINLIKSKKTIYFLVGSGEPSTTPDGEKTYAQMAEALKNRAYDVKEHNITAGDLPLDASLVVVGSAKVPYNSVVENMLRRVLARGGRVIMTVSPYRDPGMAKLFSDLGVKFEDTLLVNNRGATPLGGQLAQLDPMRPPLVVGQFSRESPITSVFSPRDIALADGARPISFVKIESKEGELKIKQTALMSAFEAAPIAISESDRSKLSLEGPLNLQLPTAFDAKKTYGVGVHVEIENPAKLAEGLPAATIASNTGSLGLDAAAPTPAATPGADGKIPEAKKDDKPIGEMVILGFDLAGRYEGAAPANSQLLPLAVAHLYRDKELVSIPTKDFAPKAFNLEKNPGAYVFLFSGLLPLATALAGFYIWMRRRSA